MTREEFAKGRDGAAAAGRNKTYLQALVFPLSQSRPESASDHAAKPQAQSPYGWLAAVLPEPVRLRCLIVCGGRAYSMTCDPSKQTRFLDVTRTHNTKALQSIIGTRPLQPWRRRRSVAHARSDRGRRRCWETSMRSVERGDGWMEGWNVWMEG